MTNNNLCSRSQLALNLQLSANLLDPLPHSTQTKSADLLLRIEPASVVTYRQVQPIAWSKQSSERELLADYRLYLCSALLCQIVLMLCDLPNVIYQYLRYEL